MRDREFRCGEGPSETDGRVCADIPVQSRNDGAEQRWGTMGLLIGGQRMDVAASGQWQKFQFSAIPGGSIDQVTFAIAIPEGGEVELAGVQADFGADSPEYRQIRRATGIVRAGEIQGRCTGGELCGGGRLLHSVQSDRERRGVTDGPD